MELNTQSASRSWVVKSYAFKVSLSEILYNKDFAVQSKIHQERKELTHSQMVLIEDDVLT